MAIKETHCLTIDRSISPMSMLTLIGGHQQVSEAILRSMPIGLGMDATEFIVARPKLDRYMDAQVTAEQAAQLYAENNIFPDPHALLSAILSDPSMRDGRHYAAQWQVGEEYFFLAACFYKGEWYIHSGSSGECWAKSWGGEEWHFVGTPPVKMDPLF